MEVRTNPGPRFCPCAAWRSSGRPCAPTPSTSIWPHREVALVELDEDSDAAGFIDLCLGLVEPPSRRGLLPRPGVAGAGLPRPARSPQPDRHRWSTARSGRRTCRSRRSRWRRSSITPTGREAEVIAEATVLARRFGLPGLPIAASEQVPARRPGARRLRAGLPWRAGARGDRRSGARIDGASWARRWRRRSVQCRTAAAPSCGCSMQHGAPAARYVDAPIMCGGWTIVDSCARGGCDEALDARRLPVQPGGRRDGADLRRRCSSARWSMPAC